MPEWLNLSLDILGRAVVIGVMLTGLLGLVVPLIPGLVIIWLAGLGYGIAYGFSTLGWWMFAIMTVLMIGGSFVDNVLMGTKAYQSGAAWWSVALALVAGIAGNFIMPVIGGLLAALLALFTAEWIQRKNWREAMTAAQGWFIGCGWAFAIRFIIGVVMIGLWAIWAWV